MRSLWKGAISFGLVHIPVKLYAATERQDIRFTYLHQECHTPIRYQKTCPNCQREVEQPEIVKGFEFEKDRFVVLSEEDFDAVAVAGTKTVDIVDFVDLEQIDPIYFDKSYFLEPADGGGKAYRLLRSALVQTKKIAIARVVIRSKQVLAVIRVYDDALAMETVFFPQEIRSSMGLSLAPDVEVSDKELDMAVSLIRSLSRDFDPGEYTNEYRDALWAVIQQKINGLDVVQRPDAAVPGPIVDLMAALEASLQAANEQRHQTSKPPKRSRQKVT